MKLHVYFLKELLKKLILKSYSDVVNAYPTICCTRFEQTVKLGGGGGGGQPLFVNIAVPLPPGKKKSIIWHFVFHSNQIILFERVVIKGLFWNLIQTFCKYIQPDVAPGLNRKSSWGGGGGQPLFVKIAVPPLTTSNVPLSVLLTTTCRVMPISCTLFSRVRRTDLQYNVVLLHLQATCCFLVLS